MNAWVPHGKQIMDNQFWESYKRLWVSYWDAHFTKEKRTGDALRRRHSILSFFRDTFYFKSISSGWCKFGRVYLHIHIHIHLLNFTPSVERVSGRINQDMYIPTAIFSNGYIPTAIFPTAIFSTTIFLVYINHPDHLSSSISTCDFSSHS
jgi:hypothetical protein